MSTLTLASPPIAYRRTSLWVGAMHLCLLAVVIGWSASPQDDFTPPVMMGQIVDLPSEQLKEKVVLRHAVETRKQPQQQRTMQPKSDNGSVQAVKVTNDLPSGEVSAPVHEPNADALSLHNPAPPYPRLSVEEGEEGNVLLRICVTEAGEFAGVDLARSSGFKRLDDSALNTVKRWRFIPASRAGVAIPFCYRHRIRFSLKDR